MWVWAREGDAELDWTAALLPESRVVAQQPLDGDGGGGRKLRVGLRTACDRAGLQTTKSYIDWRRWVRPSHLRGRACDVSGWEGTDIAALPRDMRLYAAADAALQLLLLDPPPPEPAAAAATPAAEGGERGGSATKKRRRTSRVLVEEVPWDTGEGTQD